MTVVAGGALVLLAILGSLGAAALYRTTDVTDGLTEVSAPALVEAVRLETALVNQETGIRGYGLSGRAEFLEPYSQGRADEEAAAGRLRELTAGDAGARADLDLVLERARAWQERVAEPLTAAGPDASAELAAELAEAGKPEFDALRDALAVQQAHFEEAADAGRADLTDAMRLRNAVFLTIAAVLVALAVLAFEGMRRGVTVPLERLSAEARQVAQGDFGHPLVATGPADLRQLGGDVEEMRRRLVDELAFAEQARRRLDDQAGELRRSNDELEQFAYVASHDLQEPLRKVASFCQLLQRRYGGQLDDRADQYIGFAVDGANRMQVLINDLLDFSRVGRLHTQRTVVDLAEAFDRAADALSVAVEESGAEITRDPLPHVVGDPTQFGMLWQNLLSNAVKFRAPDRAPRVHVSVAEEDGWWRFAVTDNGIGIDPEYAERVFAIFQRLHAKEAYPGSGIGLAMCKKIVETYGGTIAVDVTHSPGARMVFTLPVGTELPADDEADPVAAGGTGAESRP
ncbi:sensor histidine kinase [Streptomyces specialis]|uniref:sensor histidine kinase n=1 Tax=Streptomyces specialis TaxID=498367 RepID=UPI000B171230|nr:sensor histidine kinase [Streptomyces specialis]